jgi:hypothetical protein
VSSARRQQQRTLTKLMPAVAVLDRFPVGPGDQVRTGECPQTTACVRSNEKDTPTSQIRSERTTHPHPQVLTISPEARETDEDLAIKRRFDLDSEFGRLLSETSRAAECQV